MKYSIDAILEKILSLENELADGTDEFIIGLIDKSLNLSVLPAFLNNITTIYKNTFQGCKNLALTELPPNLTSIGEYAFNGCEKITLTKLPDSLTDIEYSAFSSCDGLVSIILPKSLVNMGGYIFAWCENLETVTFKGTPTTIPYSIFYQCTNLTTINVPWAEGEVANAPWGATNATINYNYTATE